MTGAGSGIGAAVAAVLLHAGWRVALTGRRAERLHQTARDAAAGEAFAVPADVTDPGSVGGLFDAVAGRWGRLDLLVNNAGVFGASAPVEDYTLREWRTVLDTSLTGAFLCAQQAFRMSP
ncbi:short-chain dehydrogenase [Mycobacterium tuberculosis]|nr:short-chain dehydrogenase [Mycobacterium tuberculosis]